MNARRLVTLFHPFLLLTAAPAEAVAIRGQLGNPQDVKRLMGRTDEVYVLFASFIQASVVGRAQLKGGEFYLNISGAQALKLRAFEACAGVEPSVPIRVYQTETILLYNNDLNLAVGPLIQADAPSNPSKVIRWMYSDKSATVLGKCDGLNTVYNLHLKAGWNAVMAVAGSGSTLTYTNVRERLPYWLSGDFRFDHARTTLPSAFFQVKSTVEK